MLTLLRDRWQNVSCECALTECRAHLKNTSQASPSDFRPMQWRLHHLSCCVEAHHGDGVVCLVVFHQYWQAPGCTHACRTITQLRSPTVSHLGERVKVMAPHGASLPCSTLGEVCLQVLRERSDVRPHRG